MQWGAYHEDLADVFHDAGDVDRDVDDEGREELDGDGLEDDDEDAGQRSPGPGSTQPRDASVILLCDSRPRADLVNLPCRLTNELLTCARVPPNVPQVRLLHLNFLLLCRRTSPNQF